MTPLSAKKILLFLVVFLASTALVAEDIPLRNWAVPPFMSSSVPSGGIRTMTDVTPGIGFVGITPCRFVDTRAASGFPGGYGLPSMTAGVPRNFDLNSHPTCTAIPAGVSAYSLNITVTNTAGDGFIKVWPQGGTVPDVSTINYVAGQTIANAAIVPAGIGGGVTAVAGVSGTDLIIDMNGYFTFEYNAGNRFVAVSSVDGAATILGINSSNANFSHAVGGFASGTGTVRGVWGQTGSGAGERSSGVHGIGGSSAAYTAGVFGESPAAFSGAGVKGVCGLNAAITAADAYWASGGVRGLGTPFGVVGISDTIGAAGFTHNPAGGALQTGSFLGYSSTVGLHTIGTTSATGAKAFVEPHPTDASKMIRYISLEGPEAGTYFRGRGRFQNGTARIEVPEDFRFVTDPEGLTVQITPIGAMATVAVLRMDLNEIVAQGSRNVEFSYLVQGVRHSFKDVQPIMENDAYRPISPEFRMPEGYAPEQKRILVENGTYRADGGVNMETATRLGWDKVWEKRNPPAPAPNPE